MPMKFLNPWCVPPVKADANLHGPAVRAWLQGQPGNRIITLTELRAGMPAIAAALTRPVVNQICADLGAAVEDPSDAQA